MEQPDQVGGERLKMGQRKEEQWRHEGMAFCLRYLDEHGGDVDALRAEIQRRGVTHTPIAITRAQEVEFANRVRKTLMETVLIVTLAVLHDEFGFGQARCKRFIDQFNYAGDLLVDDCINWAEMQQGIREQLGIDTVLGWYNGKPPIGRS